MATDLSAYRASTSEQTRIDDLFRLAPARGHLALDIGARDGYLSRRLADRFDKVVALDLETPQIDHAGIECVRGDVTRLAFANDTFDLVLCAEVLEHIPARLLSQACREIARVARATVVVGVPFEQDLRLGRTTCRRCGVINPPWGHVNSFSRHRLMRLFGGLALTETSWVGESREATNAASAALMDFAGNPYGTYEQEEGCISCGAPLQPPPARTAVQKVATRVAATLNRIQRSWTPPRGNWIHLRFEKAGPEGAVPVQPGR